MRITVLIDNKKSETSTKSEWGLSLHIQFEGKNYLFDAGQSGAIVDNAKRLGVCLENVDTAILSHAHYDHANGFPAFFAVNRQAPLYVREGTAEDCYHQLWFFRKYIGIRRGFLERYADRIRYISGNYALADRVWLIPHEPQNVSDRPYSSPHEQSLVFETKQGLVICSSCSHAGISTILQQVKAVLPSRPVYAFIGGLHLFRMPEEDVRHLASQLRDWQVEHFYVGHCTGRKAMAVLREYFPNSIHSLSSGATFTLAE